MQLGLTNNLTRHVLFDADSDLGAPAWAFDLLGPAARPSPAAAGRFDVSAAESCDFGLVTVRAPGVADLGPAAFERCAAGVYATIAAELRSRAARHPVRFWNYIPDIHRPCGKTPDGGPLDRYMVFNAGRYAACADWLGGDQAFDRLLATASGVGHAGADLVVHALAAARPGLAVENPRQVPAYRYSQRYGPKPPCFARATVVPMPSAGGGPGRPLVLVGGTASVRGEESVHVGDVAAQTAETLDNLRALVQAAAAAAGGDAGAAGLEDFREVRVYFVRPDDLPAITAVLCDGLPAARIEYVRAGLCRADLQVEIEGVAEGR
jgi:chorismate lyase/3-hydroxybenzoate synthase